MGTAKHILGCLDSLASFRLEAHDPTMKLDLLEENVGHLTLQKLPRHILLQGRGRVGMHQLDERGRCEKIG